MKVIHRSEYRGVRGQVSPLSRLQGIFQRGSQAQREMAGEDRVAQVLAQCLDDTYCLIRNLVLPGNPYDLDMVLVGPTGIWEFEILNFTGLVHTDEQGWMHWNYTQQGLQPITRELGPRTQQKATHLSEFLSAQGLPGLEVNQALILSTPDAPKEFSLPGIQVVFIDELEGFVQTALSLLQPTNPVPVEAVVEQLRQVEGREKATYIPARIWGMSPVQFFIVLALAFGDVCLLLSFLAIVLYFNF